MATPNRNVLLPEFRKRIVLPNETLASLAQQNGRIGPQYLRLSHNGYCGPDALPGQKQLHIINHYSYGDL